MSKIKNRVQGFIFGIVSATVLLMSIPTMAASLTQNIEVTFNDIKLYVNGVLTMPKDGNGKIIEPFIYNGTTYLPVRAVADAFGQEVRWDGNTQSIYVGGDSASDTPTSFSNKLEPYQTSWGVRVVDKLKMGGKSYTNGISFTSIGYNDDNFALFNLDGKYNTVEFDVGHIDDSRMKDVTVTIYLDDRETQRFEVKASDLPKHLVIPLNKALQLKIDMSREHDIYNSTDYGIGNMKFN